MTTEKQAEINKYKEMVRLQKAEIEKLKSGEAPETVRPSRSNKASALGLLGEPVEPGPSGAYSAGGPVATPPEKLAAVIDKQSIEMVELKKKLAAAEEHVASLRREMQRVKTPDVVLATKAGQCFHTHGCNHLLCGREQRAFVELRKCKDCLP